MANTYLITGAAGFIGSFLARKLLDRGDNVLGLDNFHDYYSIKAKKFNLDLTRAWVGQEPVHTPLQELSPIVELFNHYYENSDTPGKFSFSEADIRDKKALNQAFNQQKITHVIHLAAMAGVGLSQQEPELYTDVNVLGTVRLLESMREKSVNNMLFGSSSSVYGERETIPFSEADHVNKPGSPYAATKLMQEAMNYTYHSLYGMNIINARIFGPIYGPLQRPYRMLAQRFINYAYNDKPMPIYGDGEVGARDTTYIDDEVDGLVLALDRLGGGNGEIEFDTINIGTGHAISPQQVADKVIELVGKGVIEYVDRPNIEMPLTYADTSKAQKLLGFKARTDFSTGMQRQVETFMAMPEWYKLLEA